MSTMQRSAHGGPASQSSWRTRESRGPPRGPGSQAPYNRTKELLGSPRGPSSQAPNNRARELRESPRGPSSQAPHNRMRELRELPSGRNDRAAKGRNWAADRTQNRYQNNRTLISVRTATGLHPKYAQNMTKDLCYVGMIFRSVHHEEDISQLMKGPSQPSEPNTTYTKDFGDIYSKNRWMIVVKINTTEYTAVPLFTYNDNGLSRKPADAVDEYVSIRDLRVSPFSPQSQWRTLEAKMRDGSIELKKTAVVHMVYNITKRFGLPVQEEGRLTDKSIVDFLKLYDHVNSASRQFKK